MLIGPVNNISSEGVKKRPRTIGFFTFHILYIYKNIDVRNSPVFEIFN